MQTLRGAVLALSAVLLGTTLTPGARADQWDQKTIVTFSEDVQVPGQVLPAGTYIFRLADNNTDRHIVQIWNAYDNQLVTTIMTIPYTRLDPQDKHFFQFDERPAGSPVALKLWFHPGESTAEEFIYSNRSNSESYSYRQ
jgi:hypothetical protein